MPVSEVEDASSFHHSIALLTKTQLSIVMAGTSGKQTDLSASTVLVDDATDLERWRLLDEKGRQTWHYLRTDAEVEKWPQSVADRHHLGLPLVLHPF